MVKETFSFKKKKMQNNFVESERKKGDIIIRDKTFKVLSKNLQPSLNIIPQTIISLNQSLNTTQINNVVKENTECKFEQIIEENKLLKIEMESLKNEVMTLYEKIQDCVTYKEFDEELSEISNSEIGDSLSDSNSHTPQVTPQIIRSNNKFCYSIQKRNNVMEDYKWFGEFNSIREIVRVLGLSRGTVHNIIKGKKTRQKEFIIITKM